MKYATWVLIAALTTGCASEEAKKRWAIAGAALAVGAVAYAVAKDSRQGGGAPAPVQDWDWEWDQFYNQYRQLIWVCRGTSTGQFAESGRCAYKAQTDWKWPSKESAG